MNWEVIIPRNDDSQVSSSITVEAENWFTALRAGLDKQGMENEVISNINCVVKEDRTVEVTDFVTNRVFTLRPLYEASSAETEEEPACAREEDKDQKRPPAREEDKDQKKEQVDAKIAFAKPIPASAKPAEKSHRKHKKKAAEKAEQSVSLPTGLPEHNLFYSRDEAPQDGGGIYYRERLVAVPPSTTKDEVAVLARAHFEQLKAMGAQQDTKLFISVQIFDHSFSAEAQRPAVAALTWRQWNPKKPRILFPLSGEEGVTFSKMPPVTSTQEKADAQPKPEGGKKTPPEATPQKSAEPPKKPKQAPAATPRAKTEVLAEEEVTSAIDDKMFEAFERMQELYSYREHDSAAEFVLNLAREMVDCEAGSCLLLTPGLPRLYVAAAHGPFEGNILQKTISVKRGIIGFAMRSSAVVTVQDPESDPRFDPELDFRKGFHILNLVCAPIQFEGRTHGVIELIDSPHKKGFDQHDANILSYLGSSFGEYIENVLPSREDTDEHGQTASTRPQSGAAKGSGSQSPK